LCGSRRKRGRVAQRVFAFSIVYLFVLFAALLASGSINRETHILAACSSSLVKADEV
jgi:heme O synthase-like polyprenyltransferase